MSEKTEKKTDEKPDRYRYRGIILEGQPMPPSENEVRRLLALLTEIVRRATNQASEQ
jgi:hypothetical protein